MESDAGPARKPSDGDGGGAQGENAQAAGAGLRFSSLKCRIGHYVQGMNVTVVIAVECPESGSLNSCNDQRHCEMLSGCHCTDGGLNSLWLAVQRL